MMDLSAKILIFIWGMVSSIYVNNINAEVTINVLDFGALGDGKHDDLGAFSKAWDKACHETSEIPSIIIPSGKTFLLNPVMFNGTCKPKAINFKVFGIIVAPESPKTWDGKNPKLWLGFKDVTGLHVTGHGTIDGRGSQWWAQSCHRRHGKKPCTRIAPTAVRFVNCNECYLNDINVVNSAQTHILVYKCKGFIINGVHLTSPRNSPNTDGIHLQSSQHVHIQHSSMSCGDDCVSIGDRSSDIIIEDVDCGPGHGISIGSLGKDGSSADVHEVHVSNVRFKDSMNGARIKTWQGGKGYARGITFKQLTFTAVKNPIIIDQFYCGGQSGCKNMTSGVQIQNVTYEQATGTSITHLAISLNCSQVAPCTQLNLGSINLTAARHGQKVSSHCFNAHIDTHGIVQPNISCP